MTSEMIDRVAKAIFYAQASPGTFKPDWQGFLVHNADTEMYHRMARAAFEEARVPTEAMITAGDNADYFSSEGINVSRVIGNDGIASVYRAMIDAALKDK